jgi:signal transduction histidine kinase
LLRDCVKAVLNGSDVHYECFIADDLWSVNADEGQLAQVFHNLIQHARNAVTENRAIDVYATNQDIADDPLLFLPQGRYARISIRDHGAGLRADQLNKIFDPYFSAKKQGHGLELATAYSIVRKHEGQIRVESISGQGTVFHVYLPACDVAEEPSAAAAEPRSVEGAQGRVLVMDDEPGIRQLATGLLMKIGYTPAVAADGVAPSFTA